MALLEQEVEIMLNSRNIKHYEGLGYELSKRKNSSGRITVPRGSKIIVKVKDLPKKSHIDVKVECDYCGHQFLAKYKDYLNGSVNSLVKKVACKECFPKKMKDVLAKTRADRIKNVFDIYPLFYEKDFIPLFQPSYYERNSQKLPYICKKHPQEIQYITLINLHKVGGCRHCGVESLSGENSYLWKGGISDLDSYLRQKINTWKKDSMKKYNYKCVVTGERFDAIHHLHSFNLIRDEALNNLNLDIRPEINQYEDEELEAITNKIIKLHERYGLGVPLRSDIHELFHNLYSYGDNTPEQFEEFKIRYRVGEFDKLLNTSQTA